MTYNMNVTSAAPFMVVGGNHEGNSHCGNANANSDYADLINRFTMPMKATQNNFYYSYDIGNVHFSAINTDLIIMGSTGGNSTAKGMQGSSLASTFGTANAAMTAMINWLKTDLSGTTQQWKVVYGHRPFYTNYYAGASSSDKNQLAASLLQPQLEALFIANKVDLFIQADVHGSERLHPMNNGAVVQTGPNSYNNPGYPIYLVCGNAGEKGNPTGVGAYLSPNVWKNASPFVNSNNHGYCDITFTATTMSYNFVNTDPISSTNTYAPGASLDNFTLTKPANNNAKKLRKRKMKKTN